MDDFMEHYLPGFWNKIKGHILKSLAKTENLNGERIKYPIPLEVQVFQIRLRNSPGTIIYYSSIQNQYFNVIRWGKRTMEELVMQLYTKNFVHKDNYSFIHSFILTSQNCS